MTLSLQMDEGNDNDVSFQLGPRGPTPLSSRESSPAAKRQKRALTPASDDGGLVVPVAHDEEAQTPTPENVPLIRQAVGFSWTPSTSTNVSTYQATVAAQPVVPYFLPGQAPPPPPNPRTPKPRAPKRKKGTQYSEQTSKFRLRDPTLPPSPVSGPTRFAPISAGNSTGTSSSNRSPAPSRPMNSTSTRNTSKKKNSAPANSSFGQPRAQPSPVRPTPIWTFTSPQYSSPGGTSRERPEPAARSPRSFLTSGGASTNGSTTVTPGAQGPRPLRMVTLFIEDVRSGVPDSQLTELKVPLRFADDPEDGFWADAVEVCNALQGGPSRIDGPAKVYTMRGRFRQFFMRVDQFDQFQAQSAHLNVSKERVLNVYVETPVPQGHLPRPPTLPSDARCTYSSGSEHEATSSPSMTHYRPTYSLVTREDQIERLSKSNYIRAEKRRLTPVSESGSYGHSQRTASPNARGRHHASQRSLTPPIPGKLADTQEERDDAIANYIRSHIENHAGWVEYMQSKAKSQRVCEVLKQYSFVEDRVRELIGRETPTHWDGAPNCYVGRQHVWRVLKLDTVRGEECHEITALVGFYGPNGSRYEDSRVVDMISDTSPFKGNPMEKFIRLLRSVDDNFSRDMLGGRRTPTPVTS